ncbi:hypothetical protein GCM10023231_37550 [Olivibacter ginsenosidimutans]|uniref:L,D-TPase catalytic domain-containing protein n=2 Tax=Olivibacter ginsenosidimutans TaxID=1176537 RepID=A0ABP9C9P7_9SPHI
MTLAGVWTACTKSSTPLGKILYQETKNQVYQNLDADSLAETFKAYMVTHPKAFKNPKYIERFYQSQQYIPVLLTRFYADSSLFQFIDRLEHIGEHGLSPHNYPIAALKRSLQELSDKSVIRTPAEAYTHIVASELLFADAFTNYSIALQYGQLNPRRSLSRYYIPVARPDSLAFMRVLSTQDLASYLDSIQPKNVFYRQLQQALQTEKGSKVMALTANLERLRWKMERDSDFMVYVNIPAYQLTVLKDREPVAHMKVVVGKADGHETPLLSSRIHSVQVNPIWNIPASIAKKEILVQAKADKFYLSNHGMDVYYKGKKVADADSIDWSGYNEDNLPYSFKQRPGDANSLGLIKFLFNNGSSVYLHDTPAKAVFSRKMRAASHGCVRVEQPLDLAHALFGEGEKYQTIQEEMGSENPVAKTIGLSPKPQVLLDYATCAPDEAGALTFYPDVYGLDSTVYRLLLK